MAVVSPAPVATSPRSGAAPDRRFALLLILVGLVYLLTATWSPPYNVDTFTNALQARAFAADSSATIAGSEHLVSHEYFGNLALLVEAEDGSATSQYPPGVALWGAAFYLIDPSVSEVESLYTTHDGEDAPVRLLVPSFAPATMAAVVATTLAMLFLGLTLRRHVSEGAMLATVSVVAFGTGAWSVASDQLWQHSPGMLAISAAMYFASTDRFVGSGVAFAAAALIRPHTAIMAAAVGIAVAVRRRRLKPMVEIGVASGLGIAAVVAYNAAVFGSPSISGGYGSTFADRALSGSGTGPLTLAARVVESLVHPDHGMLVSSPVLVVALVALGSRARRAPDWAIGGAIGAVAYLLVQYKANRVSGGNVIFGYRYPLDPMMAAVPLLALATTEWVRTRRRRVLLVVLAVVSVVAHGYGAVFVGP